MKQESFLTESNLFWFWVATALMALFGLWYLFDHPIGGSNGGTVYGYTSGIAAALGMVFLMMYAKRKRAYTWTLCTLKGWLSAHVWIGLLLIILVPLHSGFSFAWNMHTLLFVLMVLTIITGIWGVIMFIYLPPQMAGRREGLIYKTAVNDLGIISTDMAALGKGRSDQFHRLLNRVNPDFQPKVFKIMLCSKPLPDIGRVPEVLQALQELPAAEQGDGIKLVSLAAKKTELCNKLTAEVRTQAWLKAWLYLHVPLASGTFLLMIIHIFSVFYRW